MMSVERERCVGTMKLRVEEGSLVEWDASHGGLDLPNWVGQVIRLMGRMKLMKRKCGVEMRVERPVEKSGG